MAPGIGTSAPDANGGKGFVSIREMLGEGVFDETRGNGFRALRLAWAAGQARPPGRNASGF